MHKYRKTGLIALFAAAASASAFAIDYASTNVYWTRGYDGTIDGFDATTTNNIFTDNGSGVFSDRLINAANNIHEVDALDPAVVDQTTGARTEESVTASASTDGSLYLHIGYINSGFTGAGTTIDDVVLNGDLTVGRLAFEGRYQRPAGTYFDTPNLPVKLTAGATDYTLIFDYTGTNNLFYTRGGTTTNGGIFQLDCNINLKNATNTTAIPSGKYTNDTSMICNTDYDTLIIGSENVKRTLTITKASGVENLFWNGKYSTLKVYSDLTLTSDINKIYRGTGNFEIYGNTIINDTRTSVLTNNTDFAFMFMSGSGDAANPGTALVKGDITIASTFPKYFYVFYANMKGNQITMDGNLTVNSLKGTTGFEVVRLLVDNQKATFNGNTIINGVSGTSTAYLYRLFSGKNLNITMNGDVTINSGAKTYIYAIGGGVSNSSIDVYGDLYLKNNDGATSIFYNNSSTSVMNFYGNINITANTGSENILAASRKAGSVTNYFGKIDTSSRTQQTSFASADAGSIVNFKGKVDNTFNNLGLRSSVFNLMNTNGSAAISADSYIALGGAATLNIFGQNQIKVQSSTTWQLWGPLGTTKVSGIINLNGTSLEMGTFQVAGSTRSLTVDFGMTNSGLTSAQMAAQGITSGMINATGAGIGQTFTIGNVIFNFDEKDISKTARVEDCFILFKNYVVGEDRIISYVQLSELTLNGDLAYSKTDILENILRIDGYTDADLYGKEYWLEEIASTDEYYNECWEYKLVFAPIPEASTIAAIFGTLALGFVSYRRRK